MSRRTLLGALFVTGAGAVAQRTGAFSSISADRVSNVGIGSDDTAVLGIASQNPSGRDGDTVSVLTLTNNRASGSFDDVTVTQVSTEDSAVGFANITTPNDIPAGQSASIEAQLGCTDAISDVAVELEITVSGDDGFSVTTTREVFVSCESVNVGPDVTGVEWLGGGIRSIDSPEDTTITVDVWYHDGGDRPKSGTDDFGVECSVQTDTNSNIQSDLPGRASTHIAVYIHESDESWHHPKFDPNAGEMTGWDENADGVSWGDGTIASAFDVTCEDRPSANDVYDIRREDWLDDREYIFEIVHNDVWNVEWDFGDGTTSTEYYAEHAYDTDGTYNVALTVVIDGEEYTYTDTVEVKGDSSGEKPPSGDVYDIYQEAWLDDREYIFEIVHNDVWNVEWDFGDGTTSTNQWVRHTFAEDGTYQIELTATVSGEEYTYTDTVEVETDQAGGPPGGPS